MVKCLYLLSYISAVTGNKCWSGCPTKQVAEKQARDLEKDGAKQVKIYDYKKGCD